VPVIAPAGTWTDITVTMEQLGSPPVAREAADGVADGRCARPERGYPHGPGSAWKGAHDAQAVRGL
jgi:hypothetical protein